MRRVAILVALAAALSASAATSNNDDSCDIGLYPAATLLLPYFEVETANRGVDTFFTVTNASPLPQIAKVTIWTDWAMPVISFPLFLTGYDVQSISLFDVIAGGAIAPANAQFTAGGTSSKTQPGSSSAANDANPNLVVAGCDDLPGVIQSGIRAAVLSALVNGKYTAAGTPFGCGNANVGSGSVYHRTPTSAIGFVTIDVVSRCSFSIPSDPAYFANELLFDNVLTGDYATLDKTNGSNYAGGNPLVHIRAVPEGGVAGSRPVAGGVATNLPYTFYGRFINGQSAGGVALPPHLDRRQPLPSTFAVRFIEGGRTSFSTDLKIWREGFPGPTTCANASKNRLLDTSQTFVRFDEHENAMTWVPGQITISYPFHDYFPATGRYPTAAGQFPYLNSPGGDNAGWLYLNLDSGVAEQTVNTAAHPAFGSKRPSQNWVVISMSGSGSTAGLFGTELDATPLGNGCSPPAAQTEPYGGSAKIGSSGGVLVCPPGFVTAAGAAICLGGPSQYTGTNVNP